MRKSKNSIFKIENLNLKETEDKLYMTKFVFEDKTYYFRDVFEDKVLLCEREERRYQLFAFEDFKFESPQPPEKQNNPNKPTFNIIKK